MGQSDTKTEILDAAEKLFARDGFHATSLRSITTEANVNLAAVNYHFGSKQELIQAVIERRILPLNAERMERLGAVTAEAKAAGRKPRAGDVLRAFVEPTFRFGKEDAAGGHFMSIVGRGLYEPDDTVRNIFIGLIRPLFIELFKTLCAAMPKASKTVIFWHLHFALGAMSHTLHVMDKVRMTLPPGVEPVEDVEAMLDLYLPFMEAGMGGEEDRRQRTEDRGEKKAEEG